MLKEAGMKPGDDGTFSVFQFIPTQVANTILRLGIKGMNCGSKS
jgi:hypothetical protein